MIKYLEKESDFQELTKEGLVLVDFYADWCGPCKMLGEELEKLDDIDIIKVNTDSFMDIALKHGVMSIPALFLYKDGNIIKNNVGYLNYGELVNFVKE